MEQRFTHYQYAVCAICVRMRERGRRHPFF